MTRSDVVRQPAKRRTPAMFTSPVLTLASLVIVGAVACSPDNEAAQSDSSAPMNVAQTSHACWVRGDAADLPQRASKLDSSSVVLGSDTVKVCYGRPALRGRELMGGLVPYGAPWRLGANEATAVRVTFPATIAGVNVEPGWYSVYTVPSEGEWQIVVNSVPQRWGIPIDSTVRAADIGSGTVPATAGTEATEALSITLASASDTQATMQIRWGNTAVDVPIAKR